MSLKLKDILEGGIMKGKQATVSEERIERVTFSTRIDKNIIRSLKMISAAEEKDVYLLVEEAFERFIAERKH